MKIFAYVLSAFVFAALAGLYGAACWFDYGLWSIAVWAAMIAAIPLCSLIHELGHILFGAICSIKAKPHFSLFGSSSCSIIPKKATNIKVRVIFTALSGILINLAVCCVVLILIGFNVIPKCCSFLIPANAYLAILNVMPVQFAAGKTDGLVVNEIINNEAEAEVMLAVLTLQAQVLNGMPIAEADEKLLFGLPVIREDDPAFISLTELRYEYFKAKGEEEQAEQYRQRLEELKEYID